MSFDHSVNFLSVSPMVSDLVFITQPSTVCISDIPPSTIAFSSDRRLSLVIGLVEETSLPMLCMLKGSCISPFNIVF